MSLNRRFALHTLGAAGLAAVLAGCGQDKPAFKGIDLSGADYAKDFELTDHLGQRRRL